MRDSCAHTRCREWVSGEDIISRPISDIVNYVAVYFRNNHLELEDGPLKQFLDEAGDLNPEARGTLLAGSEALVTAHSEAVSHGGPQPMEAGALHLVCFVRAGDQVYDMDSLASKPHWVAECEDNTFPSQAIKAARAYLDRWTILDIFQCMSSMTKCQQSSCFATYNTCSILKLSGIKKN